MTDEFASYRNAGLLAVAAAGGSTLSDEAQRAIYNAAYSAEVETVNAHKRRGGTGLRKRKLLKTRKIKRKYKH